MESELFGDADGPDCLCLWRVVGQCVDAGLLKYDIVMATARTASILALTWGGRFFGLFMLFFTSRDSWGVVQGTDIFSGVGRISPFFHNVILPVYICVCICVCAYVLPGV